MADEPQAAAEAAANQQSGTDQACADETAKLREELAEAKDRALRTMAELDNYRKRARRDMEDERRFANQALLHDLLAVVDNVDRAIQAAEKSPEAAAVTAGFKMVAQQLDQILGRYHTKRIPALNEPFDPHLHQAIAQQPSADVAANSVVAVAQHGYQLHDRVLRPAQVVVSTGPAKTQSSSS